VRAIAGIPGSSEKIGRARAIEPAEAERWAAQFKPSAGLRKQRHTESATSRWTP